MARINIGDYVRKKVNGKIYKVVNLTHSNDGHNLISFYVLDPINGEMNNRLFFQEEYWKPFKKEYEPCPEAQLLYGVKQ